MNGNKRLLSLIFSAQLMLVLACSKPPNQVNPKPVDQQRRLYVPKASDFVIVCTLYNGEPPESPSTLQKVPITIDPRFLIGARVEEVVSGSSPWPKGTKLIFIIHSPSMMFGGGNFSGRRYSLTFAPFIPSTKQDQILFKPETRQVLKSIKPIEDK